MSYNPGYSSAFSMAFDSERGFAVLYKAGAIVQEYPLPSIPVSEVWHYGGRGWAKCIVSESLIPSSRPEPRARSNAAIAFDAARRETVLFGGLVGFNQSYSGETWTWDGSSWSQRLVTGPTPRAGHAMVYDSRRGVVVLFGGSGSEAPTISTWEWDGASWAHRSTPISPPAQYGHVMAYDANRGVTVLFSRGALSGPLSETWEWNGDTWTRRAPVHSPLPALGPRWPSTATAKSACSSEGRRNPGSTCWILGNGMARTGRSAAPRSSQLDALSTEWCTTPNAARSSCLAVITRSRFRSPILGNTP